MGCNSNTFHIPSLESLFDLVTYLLWVEKRFDYLVSSIIERYFNVLLQDFGPCYVFSTRDYDCIEVLRVLGATFVVVGDYHTNSLCLKVVGSASVNRVGADVVAVCVRHIWCQMDLCQKFTDGRVLCLDSRLDMSSRFATRFTL